MAKEFVVKLQVDSSGAVSNIDAVDKAITDSVESTKSLKAQLREITQQLSTMSPDDDGFDKLSKKAGQLKDQINDASEAIRANAGNAFESLGNNAQNLGSRLLNLDFEGVGQSAKAMGTSVKSINLNSLTKEVGGAIKGFLSLGKALLANPIFLIGAAVVAVIANFERLKGLVDGVSSSQKESLELAQANVAAEKTKTDLLSASENILKLQGKSEREILQMKIAQTEQEIAKQKVVVSQMDTIAQAQIQAAERNKNITKGILQFLSAPLQMITMAIDTISKKLVDLGVISSGTDLSGALQQGIDSLASMVFDPEEVKKEAAATKAAAEKELLDMENRLAGHKLAIRAIDKSANDKRLADQKAADDAMLAQRKEYMKNLEELHSKGAENLKTIDTGLAQSRTMLQQTEAQKLEAQERAERERRIEATKNAANQTLAISGEMFAGLQAINELFAGKSRKSQERAFKISKGLRMAEVVIDTYKAATTAMATYPPPFGGIVAGAQIAMGLANLAKIRAQKFDGGGASGGGGGGISQAGAGAAQSGQPTFNPIDNSFLGNRPQQPMRTYVLAENVTNAQDANQKIKNLARLG